MAAAQKLPENLYLRGGGVWWIRYSVNGKKIRRSLKTAKVREAKRLRDQILGKRSAAAEVRERFGLASPGDDGAPVLTVAEVAERFLTYEQARGRLRKGSTAKLKGVINGWTVPELGAERLITSIGLEDVEMFLGRLRTAKKKRGEGTLGKYQVKHIANVSARMFRYAVRRKLAPSNPFDLLEKSEKPEGGKPRDEWLTFDEIERLLAKLGEGQLGEMVRVAFFTGLRWGELSGLAWADLDLEGAPATITPRRSYNGPLKNEASGQAIELHTDTAALLRRLKAVSETSWVFPSARGEVRRAMPNSERDRIHEAARDAGITKHVTPHVFRHSYGTHLYAATRDLQLVSRAMRHANIAVTMRIYVHDTNASIADAVAAFPSLGAPKLRAV